MASISSLVHELRERIAASSSTPTDQSNDVALESRFCTVPLQSPYFLRHRFTFRDRHGVILETIGCLLALLRSGNRGAYRQFFVDAMLVIEDLEYAASVYYSKSSMVESVQVTLK